jgi:2-dehydropantoate 2-reductase
MAIPGGEAATPGGSVSAEEWQAVAVLGAGAVGSYFGAMLARAGAPVTLIGRSPHVEAVTRDGLDLDSVRFRERIRINATVDVAAARDARIVLLCVKTPDTEEAAKLLSPHLAAGATVVSMQNGVDNVVRIREASGIDAVPAVVYVAVEMTGPGAIRHTGRGDLIVGNPSGGCEDPLWRDRCLTISDLFTRAGVPCRVSSDIVADLWTKLVMNCAYNAISALSRTRYGPLVKEPLARELMRRLVDEILCVARARRIRMPNESDLVEAVWRLGDGMPGAISSTAQDIAAGRRTEIDSLNGYVARLGAELGVPTPVNQTLHSLVKLLEGAVAL